VLDRLNSGRGVSEPAGVDGAKCVLVAGGVGRLVGKRVVLVRDGPATVLLFEAERQAQPLVTDVGGHAAAQQRVGVSDVVPGVDVELDVLEDRALSLPLEEVGPGALVGVEPADTLLRGGTSNMTMSSAWSMRTPVRSPSCTALAQRSTSVRICCSSVGMGQFLW
jgi:hypothetical protein